MTQTRCNFAIGRGRITDSWGEKKVEYKAGIKPTAMPLGCSDGNVYRSVYDANESTGISFASITKAAKNGTPCGKEKLFFWFLNGGEE